MWVELLKLITNYYFQLFIIATMFVTINFNYLMNLIIIDL
jgi:hypothetical protein